MLDIASELKKKSRTELNIIAKKLNILQYHKLGRSKLVDTLLKQDQNTLNVCLRTLKILKFREYFFAIGAIIMLCILFLFTISYWASVKNDVESNLYETGIDDPLIEISLIFLTPMVVYYSVKILFAIWNHAFIPIVGCVALIFIFGATYFFLYGYLFDVAHWLFYVSLCYFVWIFIMTILTFFCGLHFKDILSNNMST